MGSASAAPAVRSVPNAGRGAGEYVNYIQWTSSSPAAGVQDVFGALPAAVHEGAVRAYVAGASHAGLTPAQADMLVAPWLGTDGQQAFYRQIAQADQAHTDEIEPRYPELDLPVLIIWGREDTWIPVDRADRLAQLIPGSRLELIAAAGHLVQIDQPVALATTLHGWLTRSRN